jgi:DNA-directed RNA polymerase specialized sigma24 family protein
MKAHGDLASWPKGFELIPRTPAGQALDSKLVTEADLVRLKVIAQLHARGLPPDIGWADLLQEAFTRVLEGSRRKPAGVPMVAFLAGVMRSLREQYWRQARRGSRQMPKLLADLEVADAHEDELPDPAPNPERRAIAMQAIESMKQIFAEDVQAQQIIAGLFEGWSPEEICATYTMSKTDYDSTRRRMRRTLVHAGLRFQQA